MPDHTPTMDDLRETYVNSRTTGDPGDLPSSKNGEARARAEFHELLTHRNNATTAAALREVAADYRLKGHDWIAQDLDARADNLEGLSHISRLWGGGDKDRFPDCPCIEAPCGHVVANAQCPHHGFAAGKTIRSHHPANRCPASTN